MSVFSPSDFNSDNHIHTSLCGHAVGTMGQYVESAIAHGLEKITFLEHMEEGIEWHKKTWLSEAEFDTYFREGERLRKLYQGQISIGLGVECGYSVKSRSMLKNRLELRSWDAIGISCHYLPVEGQSQHLNLFTRHKASLQLATEIGVESLLTAYFENLIEAVQFLNGTVVCHLDGVLRHIPGLRLAPNHLRQVDTLLDLMAQKGMQLEINTSGLRIRGEQFPRWNIIRKAVCRNIPLGLGSDAHRPEDVGSGFDQLRASKPE